MYRLEEPWRPTLLRIPYTQHTNGLPRGRPNSKANGCHRRKKYYVENNRKKGRDNDQGL